MSESWARGERSGMVARSHGEIEDAATLADALATSDAIDAALLLFLLLGIP